MLYELQVAAGYAEEEARSGAEQAFAVFLEQRQRVALLAKEKRAAIDAVKAKVKEEFVTEEGSPDPAAAAAFASFSCPSERSAKWAALPSLYGVRSTQATSLAIARS